MEKHNHYGNVHAVEKLRQSIEIWYATSEYLRQEMNPNFRMTDPLNPVHIMSFSGARGNASQVHQLVGMRGLMSDRSLAKAKFCNVLGHPISKAVWADSSDFDIIDRFLRICRNLSHYYNGSSPNINLRRRERKYLFYLVIRLNQ